MVLGIVWVYRFAGLADGARDPRANEEYRAAVLAALGLEPEDSTRYHHLTPADRAVFKDLFRLKAGAMWIEGIPRTTVRGVLHVDNNLGGSPLPL